MTVLHWRKQSNTFNNTFAFLTQRTWYWCLYCTGGSNQTQFNNNTVGLSGNDLGTGDCTALAKAIKKNSTITQLDLSWNDLGTCDCTTLAEAIKHNLTMTQ